MANEDDDVLTSRQSHPEVTTLLIIGCLSLITAISLSVNQLSHYVNPETRRDLNEFKVKPVTWALDEIESQHKSDLEQSGLTLERDD